MDTREDSDNLSDKLCGQKMFQTVDRDCEELRIKELKSLLEQGGNINEVDQDENTLLHVVALNGYRKVAKFLLSIDIDRDAKNIFGQTALDIAKENQKYDIIEILESLNDVSSADLIPSLSEDIAYVSSGLGNIDIDGSDNNHWQKDHNVHDGNGDNFNADNDGYDNSENGLKRNAKTLLENPYIKKRRASDSFRDNLSFPGDGKKLNEHGTDFQNKLLMLFLWRATERNYKHFRLATELKQAEKFDDVVLQYVDKDCWKFRLLQAKHQEPEDSETALKKIKMTDLLSLDDKNNFSLQKYFRSYIKIKKRCNEKSIYSVFSKSEIEDVLLVTNTNISDDVRNHLSPISLKDDVICSIDTYSKQPQAYQIKRENNILFKTLKLIVEDTSDFNRLIKSLACCLFENKPLDLKTDIFSQYYYPLLYDVFGANRNTLGPLRFQESFLNFSEPNSFRRCFIEEIAFRYIYQRKVIENIKQFDLFKSESGAYGLSEDDDSLREIAKKLAEKFAHQQILTPSDFELSHIPLAQHVISPKSKKFHGHFINSKTHAKLKTHLKDSFTGKIIKQAESKKRITNQDLKSVKFNVSEDFGITTLPNDDEIINSTATCLANFLNDGNQNDKYNHLTMYFDVLTSSVIDLDAKILKREFIAGSPLTPVLKKFRGIFISKIITASDMVTAVNYLKDGNIAISEKFLHKHISKNCEIENTKFFAQQLAKIVAGNKYDVTLDSVNQEQFKIVINSNSVPKEDLKTFRRNIFQLAGHVLVRYFNKVRVSSTFIHDECQLDENIQCFRTELKHKLGDVYFMNLFKIHFDVQFPNFFTCEEGDLYQTLPLKCTEEDLVGFIKKLKFVLNYPNRQDLNEIIKADIGKKRERFDVKAMYAYFYEQIHDWMSDRVGTFLTPLKAECLLDDLARCLLPWGMNTLNKIYSSETQTHLQFKPCELISQFLTQNKKSILHITGPRRAIETTRVRQTFNSLRNEKLNNLIRYTYNDGYIFTHVKELADDLFFKDISQCFSNIASYNLLIIEYDSKSSGAVNLPKICGILNNKVKFPYKKIILISENKDFRDSWGVSPNLVETHSDNTSYKDITEKSLKQLLERKRIIFQGQQNRISFADIMGETNKEKISKIIDIFFTLDNLVKYLNEMDITIGNNLKTRTDIDKEVDFYISRYFYHPKILNFAEFKKDVVEEKLLDYSVIFNSKMKSFGDTVKISAERNGRKVDNIFKKVCSETEEPVHLFKKIEKNLILIKSRGSFDNVIKYKVNLKDSDSSSDKISEDQLINNSKQIVAIADIAGMGKSATLVQLGTKLKEKYPNKWVISIDLKNYEGVLEKELKEQRAKSSDYLKVKEDKLKWAEWAESFLLDTLLESDQTSKLKEYEKNLFKLNLEVSSKIILLFDDFDHIKDFDDVIIDLINALSMKVEKVFLATRLSRQAVIESKLKIFCHMFHSFTTEDSEDFLRQYWEKNIHSEIAPEVWKLKVHIYAKALLSKLSSTLPTREQEFLGIPLLTRLLAVISQSRKDDKFEGFREFLNDPSMSPILPEKIDLLELYEQFIEIICKRYFEKINYFPKGRADIENFIGQQELAFRKEHTTLALSALFKGETLKKLGVDSKKRKIGIAQGKKDQRGLVSEINKNKPVFHHTLAEYFIAEYIKENINNRPNSGFEEILYSKILVLPEHKIIRLFLYNMDSKKQFKDDTTLSYFLKIIGRYEQKDVEALNIFEKIVSVDNSDIRCHEKISAIINTIKIKSKASIEKLVTRTCISFALNKELSQTFDLLLGSLENKKIFSNLFGIKSGELNISASLDQFKDQTFKDIVSKHIRRLGYSENHEENN